MDTKHKPSGIEGLGDMSWGAHFCLFYETEQDLLETLALYFKPGLENNEFCLWSTPDPLVEKARSALIQVIPSADQHLVAGNIEIHTCQEWHCADQVFDAARAIQSVETKLTQALDKGYMRMRVLADDAWLTQENWKAFCDFEGQLDEQFAGKPISILCAYPSANHSAADILDIARTHRFITAKRNGKWEILESPELKHVKAEAEQFAAELDEPAVEPETRRRVEGGLRKARNENELEDKVQERTAHLSRVNQALQAEIIERRQALEALTESQVRLQVALEAAQIGTGEWEFQTNQVSLSESLGQIYGFAPSTLTTSFAQFAERVHPEDRDYFSSKLAEALASETDFGLDYRVVWPDGSVRWVTGRAHIHRDELSKPTRMVGASMDITELKRAEEALRVSEARLQAAIDAADIVLWERDLPSGRLTWLGHSEKVLGLAPGEFDGTLASFEDLVHPEDIEELRKVRQRALEERSEYIHEYRVVWPDGRTHWIAAHGRFIYNEAGQPLRIYGAVLDITERKQAEAELQKNKEILQTVFDNVPVMITMVDKDGRFILTNRDFENRLGWRPDEISKQNPDMLAELYPDPHDREAMLDFAERADGRWEDFQTKAKDGRAIDTSWAIVRLSDGSIIGVGKDITERKRMEKALREREAKLKEAQQLAHIGYWERDLIADRITGSEEAYRIYGLQPKEGAVSHAKLQEMIHPEDRQSQEQAMSEALQGYQLYDVEYRIIRPDGDLRFVYARDEIEYDESGRPIRMFGAVQDITERKRAEEALRKSERVLREAESLGHTGSWEQNLVTGEIFQTEENLHLFFGDDHNKGVKLEDYIQVVHPDDRKYVIQRRAELLEEEGPGDIEYRVVWPDGSVHVIFGRATVVRDESGQAVRVYGTNVDITDRKLAEEEIRRHAARMEALAEISRTFAEAGLDYQSVLNTVAQRTAELIGDACVMTLFSEDAQKSYPVAFHHPDPEARAMMHEALLHSWQGGTDTQRYQALLAGNSIYFPEVDPDEFRTTLEPEFLPFMDAFGISSILIVPIQLQGKVIGTLGVTRDRQSFPYTPDDLILLQHISDQAALSIQNARLFEQVQAGHQRLQTLSSQLLIAQEAERRTLARELHDEVGQILSGLMMQLGMARSQLPKSANSAQTILEGAEALIQEILERTRGIIAGLRPQVLDDLGLVPAVRRLASEFQEDTGARVEIKTDHIPNRLPAQLEVTLFRIVQEGLTNVRKHAQAHQVSIRLAKEDGQVVLSVQDDGLGFEKQPGRPRAEGDITLEGGWRIPDGHFGLIGIQERAAQLGGRLQVTSAPGQGTILRVEIPLPELLSEAEAGSDERL